MYAFRDVPGQPVLPQIVGPDRKCPAVAVGDDPGLLVENGKEPQREEVEQTGEEHALDVGDQLGLPDESVETGGFLKALEKSRLCKQKLFAF